MDEYPYPERRGDEEDRELGPVLNDDYWERGDREHERKRQEELDEQVAMEKREDASE